jgi:hypothetical protein
MATSLLKPSFAKAWLGSTGSDGSSARPLRAHCKLELVEPGSNHKDLKLGLARELCDVTHKIHLG